ncbi:MAG: dTDP-glucose 4,6-dehydratase [Patescibacteria group bacterium]
MTILVTGGAGFMGSHWVKYVLANYPEYRVVNFDTLTYAGNLQNLKEVETHPNYTFVHGDICDRNAVERVIEAYAINVIINYAAETHVDRSIMDPNAFLRTDILGVYNLLEAVKKFHLDRFIQISTDEVYGSILDGAFTEASPFHPNSPYAASKAGGDHLCGAYAATYKTPVIVTHSCNFYGSHQYPEKMIPLFITNLLEGKKVPLYGDGNHIREFIHASDHCRAIDAVLHKAAPGSVYNIGTGVEMKNRDTVALMLDYLGLDANMIQPVPDRPGHDRRYALDSSKIKADLGWEPLKDFQSGLHETIEWYRENAWWWQPIKTGEYLTYYKKQYDTRSH